MKTNQLLTTEASCLFETFQVLDAETKILVSLLTGEKSFDEISTTGFHVAGQKYVAVNIHLLSHSLCST